MGPASRWFPDAHISRLPRIPRPLHLFLGDIVLFFFFIADFPSVCALLLGFSPDTV
jgi:hypothetical protein